MLLTGDPAAKDNRRRGTSPAAAVWMIVRIGGDSRFRAVSTWEEATSGTRLVEVS